MKYVNGYRPPVPPPAPPQRTNAHDFVVAIEAKRPTWDSPQTLLTIEHFQEMLNFEEWLMNIEYPVPAGNETADIANGEQPTMIKFKDLCRK